MTGERLSQAGWFNPSVAKLQGKAGEAGFTSSSGGARALPSKRDVGTERKGTMRNRSDSIQVAQAGFEPE